MKQNILLVCDNRYSQNWGCRATSIALGQILNDQGNVNTITGEMAGCKHPVGFLPYLLKRNKFTNKIYNKTKNFKHFTTINKLFLGQEDYIQIDPIKSVENFLKASRKDSSLQNLKEKFESSDKIVINGEGSLIFRTPPRRDLNFQMFAVELAFQMGKEVYYINAMASNCPKTLVDNEVQENVIKTLERCTAVANRDSMSTKLLQDLGLKDVKWYPDALFTWAIRYQDFLYNNRIELNQIPQIYDVWPESDNMFKNWERWPENYICISGASRPPGIYPENWADFYVDITLKIKKELGIEVVFIDPSGDSFLYEVAVITNSFFLKPTLNLLIGSYVLGKAKVFLSGRFHPSILASLSGTPCVFLGANSHKTYSLQHVLEYEQIEVFSFENSKENLNNIIAKIENYIANEKKIRNRIINTVKSNAILASNGINNTIFK